MERDTLRYRRSFSSSLGSGLGSVFGRSGKQYFILEHKMSSKYHRVGEIQEIIVDQVEIGRDPKCQVRFDESFQTVSRRHAAIVREGDKWKLIHLSDTNPTFLNEKKVTKEWYLQNGDEIQLAIGGPKLGFIIPGGNKSSIGSLKLTHRLSLFRKQALRPYKQAIIALSVVLLLVLAGSIGWGLYSWQKQEKLLAENIRLGDALDEHGKKAEVLANEVDLSKEEMETYKKESETLAKALVRNNESLAAYKKEMENVKSRINTENVIAAVAPESTINTEVAEIKPMAKSEISECSPYVFAVFVEKWDVTDIDGVTQVIKNDVPVVTGTGFLLENGRFVTTRYVLEKWFFYESSQSQDEYKNLEALNLMASNGGEVIAYFTAVSSTGKRISFNSKSFTCNRSFDKIESTELSRGVRMVVRKAVHGRSDWAYYQTNEKEGLKYNALSSNLALGTELEILGFSKGRYPENSQLSPTHSKSNVAKVGADPGSSIINSNYNMEPGFAGGPVLVKSDGFYQVIGILSDASNDPGCIVPISTLF